MKTVLLTGATGYIGKFAVKYLLEKDYAVHAVSSKTVPAKSAEKSENVVWHRANLLSSEETGDLLRKIKPTHLLHLAWFVEHGKFWNAAENLDWLRASLNLAVEFAKNGGGRMVSAGTCAEYDWRRQSPFTESRLPFYPKTLYGAAKSSLSLTLEKFADVSDFSFASGKVFFTFGDGEPPDRFVPSIVRALLENKAAETSHGNQIRDYIFVEDAAEALVALLDGGVRGAVNIASGKPVKLKEIAQIIADAVGKPELLKIGARPVAAAEPAEIVADIRRIRREVKFTKEIDLRKRLEETVEYWKRVSENHDWRRQER